MTRGPELPTPLPVSRLGPCLAVSMAKPPKPVRWFLASWLLISVPAGSTPVDHAFAWPWPDLGAFVHLHSLC